MQNLYIILGSPQSGRREVVFDLIDGGLETEESKAVYISSTETPSPFDEQIGALANTLVLNWEYEGFIKAPPPPTETETIFFITDGKSNPVDQIESIKEWQGVFELNVARILTVVNCQLAQAHEELLPWYEACIHFTDYVLLNRREDVSNKWMREFQQYYERECYPCLFAYVKKGRVHNPPEVLDPESRRLSHLFDEIDAIDTMEFDEDDLPDEIFDLTTPTDPYLEKYDSGQRKKPIPDINDFLK